MLVVAGGPWLPLALATGASGGLLVATLVAWAGFGREAVPLRRLVALPAYVFWKLPLYFSLVGSRKQRVWERTRRKNEASRGEKQDPD